MKIYIVRHGITVWNELKKVQGCADIHLAPQGRSLAEKTGEALRDVPFDICFTSPLHRARETAALILGERAGQIPVIPDERIREINFGVLEGKVFKDQEGSILNEDLKTFFKDPWNYKRPEGGENIEDIVRRTGEFWKEKISDPDLQDKTVLITSHGCAVRALLQNVYRDKEDFWHGGPPPNCGVNVVEVADGRTTLLEKDRVYA